MECLLERLGIGDANSGVFCGNWVEHPGGEAITSINPATGEPIASVATATREDYDLCVVHAQQSFDCWRMMPPPQRGEIVRQLGQVLREHKRDLGRLVTLETGKILSEGEGEVQEMIDICDFATGLSRQLYGLTIASER
ncbi:MAG TPA: aldehyde dehydrogenase family protein, partial [Pirellulaceae bacterium]|nr:aldehyde dehydrogenase family protein [Pirellulaceae bacterium]